MEDKNPKYTWPQKEEFKAFGRKRDSRDHWEFRYFYIVFSSGFLY